MQEAGFLEAGEVVAARGAIFALVVNDHEDRGTHRSYESAGKDGWAVGRARRQR